MALSNCAKSGPAITGCVVDVKSSGFQCVTYPDKKSFLAFKDGVKLECMSPQDVEDELKACKQHQIIEVSLCSLQSDLSRFNCKDVLGQPFSLSLSDADNYFCVSDQDRKRIIERCQASGLDGLGISL